MENKIKHLEMIESIIQRLATNSFQLKGWALTLVGLIGSIAGAGSDKRFVVLAFIPLLAFWFLDTYYLQLERKFRALYRQVSKLNDNNIDFSMDLDQFTYSPEEARKVCYCSCLFSRTEGVFYLGICAAMAGVIVGLMVF